MINYDEAKYSSNTLAQVIMRIDLSNPMSNEKLFSDSREAKILEYFPNAGMIQKDKEALIHLSLPEPQWEPKPVRDILRKEYSNEDGNKFVLSNDYFLFDIHKYHTFETCMKWFKDIILVLFDEENLKISRIGLRYINLFNENTIKPTKNLFAKCIGSNFLGKQILENSEIELFRSMQLSEYRIEDYTLNFRAGLYNPDYPGKLNNKSFSLDYDCFTTVAVETFDELMTIIVKEHQIIQNIFESSITDTARKVMGNEE